MRRQEKDPATIFVTGATGRLGSRLVRELVNEGDTVRALMIAKEDISKLAQGTIPFVGTLDDVGIMDDACEGADIVFHLAAVVGEVGSITKERIKVNVEGTKKLLEVCEKNDIKHFIFTSTCDVYGKKREGALREDSRLMPTDSYGHSKMLAEQAVMKSGLPYTILRIAPIYGPGFETSMFKVFRALKEGKMVVVGKGSNHLTLVHADDVISAIMLVENDREKSVDKVYNICDGDTHTQEELLDLAADIMKVPRPKRHVSEFLIKMLARQRNLDSDEVRFLTSDRILDISKIKEDLGFRPSVSMKTGGGQLIDTFLNRSTFK